MRGRQLMSVNVGFRLAYGVGGLFAPAAMTRLGMVADTDDAPEARLFVRGFSAHQIGVALLGIAGLRRRRLGRAAALAAIAIDVADMSAAAVEASRRGALGPDLAGGVVFSAAGVATAVAALRAGE